MWQTKKNNQAKGENRLPVCKRCGRLGHTAFFCKPRKPLQVKKRMSPVGKVGRKTMAQNREFINSVPDNGLFCFYCLHLGIENLLPREAAQAEHFYSRARHPEQRLDITNRVVSCAYHNELKGSMDGDEFLELLDKQRGNNDR